MTTPNRPPLSPAAQAVLDATEDDCIHPVDRHRIAAAALRAAANQMAAWADDNGRVDLDDVFAIAAELERINS